MALSYAAYTGDGTTKNFAVPFSYISSSHVTLYVNGVSVAFVWLNAGLVQAAVAPTAGSTVQVRRKTPNDAVMVDFSDASTLSETDLDLMAKQLLFIEQESADVASTALSPDAGGRMDAQGKRIINVADPVEAQDAVTKNYFDTNVTQYRDAAIAAANSASSDAADTHSDKLAADTAKAQAQAAQAAAEAVVATQQPTFDTIAAASLATIPVGVANVRVIRAGTRLVNRNYVPGVASDPGAFVDAGGHYWKPDVLLTEGLLGSRADLTAATLPPTLNVAVCFGYAATGDCTPFMVKRVASQPVLGGVRSADRYLPSGATDSANGGWWVYVPGPAGIDACAFGVKADWDNTRTQLSAETGDTGATDNRPMLQEAMNFASMQTFPGFDSGGGAGHVVLLPKGTMMFSDTLIIPDGVILRGTGVYSTILKLAGAFSNARHAILLGTPEDRSSVCAAQTRGSAGALTLNGNAVVFGAAQMLTKRVITVFADSNNAGISFTITGTDGDGQPFTQTKAGPTASTPVDFGYYNTVSSVTVNGAITGTVTVGNTAVASFGSRAEELQVWSNHTQAQFGKSIFWSNNTQHTGGLWRVKIFAGNRSAVWFETGIGGASLFTLEDVEAFNYGNQPGVAANNPCMYFNYAGLLSAMRRVVINGSATHGGASIGIQIDGGLVHLTDSHVENYGTGILDNVRNINNGLVLITNFIGSGGVMSACVRIDNAATATPHLLLQGIMPNGAPVTVTDGRSGGTNITGNILAAVQK
jgi:hypothetical protein